MSTNAETRQRLTGGSQEDLTAGGSESIVAQARRRREAASRCEPLECGHRDPLDCTDQCGTGVPNGTPAAELAEQVDPGDIVGLWADAKSLYFARDFPEYGSQAWIDLHPDDPRRLAAALDAAECWRKYGDGVVDWLRDATAPRPPLWQRPTRTAEYWAEDARKRREAQAWAAEMRQKYGDGTQQKGAV